MNILASSQALVSSFSTGATVGINIGLGFATLASISIITVTPDLVKKGEITKTQGIALIIFALTVAVASSLTIGASCGIKLSIMGSAFGPAGTMTGLIAGAILGLGSAAYSIYYAAKTIQETQKPIVTF